MEPVLYVPGIRYRHDRFLRRVSEEVNARRGPIDGSDHEAIHSISSETSTEYATRLKTIIDADLTATEAETHPRDPGEAGGPGIEFDFVTLWVTSTALAATYLTWKEVAKDIRAAARKLRDLSEDHVVIDANSAFILAVDAVAAPGTFAVIDVRFVAPISTPDDSGPSIEKAYLVGLDVNGEFKIVVLDPDGEVVGINSGLSVSDFKSLGL
jgi:hypothetical protein